MGLWALYKSNPSSSSPFDVPRPSVSVPGKEKKRKGGEKKKKLIWVRPSRSTRSGIAACGTSGSTRSGSRRMAAADRQLVVAVEGTAALGPYWSTIVAEYVEKIVRYVRDPGPLFSPIPLLVFSSCGREWELG